MTTELLFGAAYILALIVSTPTRAITLIAENVDNGSQTVAKPCLDKLLSPFKHDTEEEEQDEKVNKFGSEPKEGDADDDGNSPCTEPEECSPSGGQTFLPEYSTSTSPANGNDVDNGTGHMWLEEDEFRSESAVQVVTVNPEGHLSGDQYDDDTALQQHSSSDSISMYLDLCKRKNFKSMLCSLSVSMVLVGIGVALGSEVPLEEFATIVTILTITTGALCLSYVRRIRNLKCAFALGQYIILMFCVTVGQLINAETVLGNAPIVAAYVGLTMAISVTLHLCLAKIFSVDADTLIVMSASCMLSPPFVPMITTSINNQVSTLQALPWE